MVGSRGLDLFTDSGLAKSEKNNALPHTKSEFDRKEEEPRLGLEMRFHDVQPAKGLEISGDTWGDQESPGEEGAGGVGMDLKENSMGELAVVGLIEGRPAERSLYMCASVVSCPCAIYIYIYIYICNCRKAEMYPM